MALSKPEFVRSRDSKRKMRCFDCNRLASLYQLATSYVTYNISIDRPTKTVARIVGFRETTRCENGQASPTVAFVSSNLWLALAGWLSVWMCPRQRLGRLESCYLTCSTVRRLLNTNSNSYPNPMAKWWLTRWDQSSLARLAAFKKFIGHFDFAHRKWDRDSICGHFHMDDCNKLSGCWHCTTPFILRTVCRLSGCVDAKLQNIMLALDFEGTSGLNELERKWVLAKLGHKWSKQLDSLGPIEYLIQAPISCYNDCSSTACTAITICVLQSHQDWSAKGQQLEILAE